MNTLYGICHLPLVPLRASASHQSEMISQIIFGQLYTLVTTEKNWLQIQLLDDSYQGWIDKNQYQEIESVLATQLQAHASHYIADAVALAFYPAKGQNMYLPFGSVLHHLAHTTFGTSNMLYKLQHGNFALPQIHNFIAMVENTARLFINVPYLWGGKTHFGIDCSGFTQQVFKLCGIQLPRDAWQQAQQGQVVDFLATAQLGDLAFFDNLEGKITHVGILLNRQQIIHASGKVKIDTIDNYGIFSEQLNKYSHKLRTIKRWNTAQL
jgi:gamma-D-glutamyl-L-lysine dipeptidyl-peptidase